MPGDQSLAQFAKFVYGQLLCFLPIPTTSFAGKTVIITGSNTGLGLEAAKHIVKLGVSKLIIAVRSVEKGEAAKTTIEEFTKCDSSIIEVWSLDLGSYASVKAFAARASKHLKRMDVLLENAGVATGKWQIVEDNESQLTVNVVSTFLLAFLLLPKLKETAAKFNTRPNITIVSSDAHFFVDFNERNAPEGIFKNMNVQTPKSMDERYPTSKLMGIYIVREMAARKPADTYPVTINMVNPGLCKSELNREGDFGVRVMNILMARTTEAGSRTLVHGAGEGPETHGQYLDRCQVAQPATVVWNAEGEKAQKRLWDELMEKLDMIDSGVSGNL